jgi:aminoglycoside 6-adenylyltransferase
VGRTATAGACYTVNQFPAVPNAPVDIFSDYDIILAVRDINPFHMDRTWLQAFGSVLTLYRDPLETYDDYQKSGYVIQYANGLKIDFILYSVEILQQVTVDPQLSDELDAGCVTLLDKDNLTDGLKPPTYTAYAPTPPNESQYMKVSTKFSRLKMY